MNQRLSIPVCIEKWNELKSNAIYIDASEPPDGRTERSRLFCEILEKIKPDFNICTDNVLREIENRQNGWWPPVKSFAGRAAAKRASLHEKEKGEIKDAEWNIVGDILKKCETAKAGRSEVMRKEKKKKNPPNGMEWGGGSLRKKKNPERYGYCVLF